MAETVLTSAFELGVVGAEGGPGGEGMPKVPKVLGAEGEEAVRVMGGSVPLITRFRFPPPPPVLGPFPASE